MKKLMIGLMAAAFLCAAAEEIPLPEHPRPDFERAAWVNLNGTWDFKFKGEQGFPRKILVPFGWGSPASGVKNEGDTGIYRRTVTVPSAWTGKRVFLVIGAADHDTRVSVNGTVVGRHIGGYVPFECELTGSVTPGNAAELEIEVWDPDPRKATDGHYLYGKQGYGNVRGIWQTVYLEARGAQYVKQVRLTPSIAGSCVRAEVELDAPASRDLTVTVTLDGGVTALPFSRGTTRATRTIALTDPKLWDLDHPHLYDVTVRLLDGARNLLGRDTPLDEVKTYFGFREIGVGKTPKGDLCVTLNGKPIYLQLCLDQSYHPEGYYTFPSDEFMKNEILISKKLGLSGNRVHIKTEVPRKLYWADKLGLLIQADVPCAWGEPTDALFAEHWACFEGMVARDFNHPCIYQWTLFNETWGLFTNREFRMGASEKKDKNKKKREYTRETQERVRAAYRKAKRLDPTRLVEDNSPCHHDHVETDINTWHGYFPGYNWENNLAQYCRTTFPGSKDNYIGGNVQTNVPMMNSECGNVWGYLGSTGDCDFTWDYHLMINAFRRHPKCCGWLYTEHHDVCNEWNGYVRYDRSPKYDGFADLAGMKLSDLHRPAALFFAGDVGTETGRHHKPGDNFSLPVGVSFVTDAYAGRRLSLSYRLWYYRADGMRRERDAKTVMGKYVAQSWQCDKLWDVPVKLPKRPAAGCIVFVLTADGDEIARNFYCFSTVPEAPVVKPTAATWSCGTNSVLGGLKWNGFGKGAFEYTLAAPAEGGVFRAELSSKRLNAKDCPELFRNTDTDYMFGGGFNDRSRNPNSYPQTSDEKHPANIRIFANGILIKETTLADDPADHRGILSWFSQKRDRKLREAGSYGYLVEADVPVEAVRAGKVTIRIESDAGLAVYGSRFGRYPLDPHIDAE